ncbi:MAG: SDR family NAD(P)-dependent oxidoreductase, partial [Myxococcota bacterium]
DGIHSRPGPRQAERAVSASERSGVDGIHSRPGPRDPVLITGATGGLGRAAALALAKRGWPLWVGGRRTEAVQEVVEEVRALGVEAQPFVADLGRLGEVRSACRELKAPLRGIVCNAGITTTKDARSADGFELTFAVNVLAHQLILNELGPQLREGGRVVIVASGVHDPENRLARRFGIPIPKWVGVEAMARPDDAPADLQIPPGPHRYSNSKLANVLQARALQDSLRAEKRSIDVFALDPGLMVDTDLAREVPGPLRGVFRAVGRLVTPWVDNMRLSTVSAEHVAALVDDGTWAGRGFAYLDGDEARPPSPDAQRADYAAALWRDASELVTAT